MISTPKLFYNEQCKNCASPRVVTLKAGEAQALGDCRNCLASTPSEGGKTTTKDSKAAEIERTRDDIYRRIIAQIPSHVWMLCLSQLISGLCTDKRALFNALVIRHLKQLLMKLASQFTNKVCWFLLASNHR
jgi:hypothetical protein